MKNAINKVRQSAAVLGTLVDKFNELNSNWGKGVNMHTARIVYEKYLNGDSITDEELKYAIKFFADLVPKLFVLGPAFRLAASEASRVLNALEGFERARKDK